MEPIKIKDSMDQMVYWKPIPCICPRCNSRYTKDLLWPDKGPVILLCAACRARYITKFQPRRPDDVPSSS